MDLLLQIIRQPVDPDYALAAARDRRDPARRPAGRHWLLAAAAVLVGALFAVAALQTTRSAPGLESERRGLIARVQDAEAVQDQLRERATTLSADNSTLRSAALGSDAGSQELQRRIGLLEPVVGLVPVRGPGVEVVVDDAPPSPTDTVGEGTDEADRVLDVDLQILANGLWQAGAEAIAVNGHRLSGLTAIRSAGDAITVDYRSLTPPYRVEAIGDPRTLPAAFAETAAGPWWHDLAQNRGMRFTMTGADELVLPADPGLTLRYAKEAR